MQKIIQSFKSISIWHILVIALLLRLILINQSFWLDEASQAMTSMHPINEIIFHNSKDFHPPLSYVLSHFWIQFGSNEIWLRLLPVLFGLGTIYAGYLIAIKMFNKKVGLLFALLLAVAPYHIYYSQEFRMYSQAAFFAVLSMYYFLKIFERDTFKNKVGFILTTTLLLYTHYMGGFIIISQVLYAGLYERKKLRSYLQNLVIIGALFLIWSPVLFEQLRVGVTADEILPGWSSMLSLSAYKAIPLLFVKFILGRIDFSNMMLYGGLVLVAFSVMGLTFLPLRKKLSDPKFGFLFLWFFIPVLITFVISLKVPMFQPFRLLYILPVFYLLVAFGISETKRYQHTLVVAVVGLLLVCQSIFWFHSPFWREDWRSAVYSADSFIQDNGYVLFAFEEEFVPYTFYSEKQRGMGLITNYNGNRVVLPVTGVSRVVYFSYLSQLTDPNDEIETMLGHQGYRLVETKDFRGVGFVHYYVRESMLIGIK